LSKKFGRDGRAERVRKECRGFAHDTRQGKNGKRIKGALA